MEQNVDETGQYVRVGLGSVLLFVGVVLGAGFQNLTVGALAGLVGGVLLLTGVVGVCPIRAALEK
ncbi:YgaP family membrane protein [Haloarchaeobius sp. TZWWS8]|uniref:YgaP family membrane protein n=1 Tax=Haloarchaeobius sp. TZWWS8 TaxID=3446121 RepID=UPI003EC1412D